MTSGVLAQRWPALGTEAVVLIPDRAGRRALAAAATEVRGEVAAMDRAASRFRDDSELSAVNEARGSEVEVSELFASAVAVALRAARITDGLVDPTVGRALRLLGYDRDFAALETEGPPLTVAARAVPGWQVVSVDPVRGTVRVPAGVQLDLGATAKALCADRAATAASAAIGGEAVLVSLGGDISVAGVAPEGGWTVWVTDRHDRPAFERGVASRAPGQAVDIAAGGLATSGTARRRWSRGGQGLHHLLDPATGRPVPETWTTVSVAAGTCVDANIASTAAVIMGARAPQWLAERGLPGRLVHADGRVAAVAGWPTDRWEKVPA